MVKVIIMMMYIVSGTDISIPDEAINVARYFSPAEPSWFMDWRSSKLKERRPDLMQATDPFLHSVEQIRMELVTCFFDSNDLTSIITHLQPVQALVPVVRSIIILRMLGDLGLLVGDSATGGAFQRIADGIAHISHQSPTAHAMTFQLAITRCKPAGNSIKAIAEQHSMSPTKLAENVGLVGSVLGSRWLYKLLGLQVSSLRGWLSSIGTS